jgi:hypothetical protein
MTNKKLLFLVALVNIIMMFMLISKQNKIIKQLYDIQQLQEQKNIVLDQHKELMLELHKLKQLSTIEQHVTKNLQMHSMTLTDAQKIPEEVKNKAQG